MRKISSAAVKQTLVKQKNKPPCKCFAASDEIALHQKIGDSLMPLRHEPSVIRRALNQRFGNRPFPGKSLMHSLITGTFASCSSTLSLRGDYQYLILYTFYTTIDQLSNNYSIFLQNFRATKKVYAPVLPIPPVRDFFTARTS